MPNIHQRRQHSNAEKPNNRLPLTVPQQEAYTMFVEILRKNGMNNISSAGREELLRIARTYPEVSEQEQKAFIKALQDFRCNKGRPLSERQGKEITAKFHDSVQDSIQNNMIPSDTDRPHAGTKSPFAPRPTQNAAALAGAGVSYLLTTILPSINKMSITSTNKNLIASNATNSIPNYPVRDVDNIRKADGPDLAIIIGPLAALSALAVAALLVVLCRRNSTNNQGAIHSRDEEAQPLSETQGNSPTAPQRQQGQSVTNSNRLYQHPLHRARVAVGPAGRSSPQTVNDTPEEKRTISATPRLTAV